MIYTHDLSPIAIQLFNVKIYWYSLAYFFGFLLSIPYAKYLLKKTKNLGNYFLIDDFLTYSVLGVILGGRIGYVMFYNLDFYLINPLEIFKIWNGGMSFHGGMIGMIFSMYSFSKKKQISFLDFSNIISACAPIGLFFGRIANFINGELYGRPTNSEWGVIFDRGEMVLRHPSQIYEAMFEGLILFFLLNVFFLNKKLNTYNTSAIFLIFYGFSRFFIEFFREPDINLGYIAFDLSMGQILSIPMILLGFLILKKKIQ